MLNQIENEYITAASPDLEALRTRVAELRAEEGRLERELYQAQDEVTAAEAAVSENTAVVAKGVRVERERVTVALLRADAAQKRNRVAAEALGLVRVESRRANETLVNAEASHAIQESVELEKEITAELQAFSVAMVVYSERCRAIQALRERARGQRLLTPAVAEALCVNWGEILSVETVLSRLERIEKVVDLPQVAAEFAYPILRAKAREEKIESERVQRLAREHDARKKPKLRSTQPFEMRYDSENKKLILQPVDY